MRVLEGLSKRHVAAILTILLLVVLSLWLWELRDNMVTENLRSEEYNMLKEENQLLHYEIENLTKQNELLQEVIGLKRKLE